MYGGTGFQLASTFKEGTKKNMPIKSNEVAISAKIAFILPKQSTNDFA